MITFWNSFWSLCFLFRIMCFCNWECLFCYCSVLYALVLFWLCFKLCECVWVCVIFECFCDCLWSFVICSTCFGLFWFFQTASIAFVFFVSWPHWFSHGLCALLSIYSLKFHETPIDAEPLVGNRNTYIYIFFLYIYT